MRWKESTGGRNLHHRPPRAERRSCFTKVAAVWILVAGKSLYKNRVIEEGRGKGDEMNLEAEDAEMFAWSREWTDTSWTFWRRVIEKLAGEGQYTEESRELATKAAKEIAILQKVQG